MFQVWLPILFVGEKSNYHITMETQELSTAIYDCVQGNLTLPLLAGKTFQH